jgi:hypothetical protein
MNNLIYQSSAAGAMTKYNGVPAASHPGCYGIEGHLANADSWGSYFYYGGSGKNGTCP